MSDYGTDDYDYGDGGYDDYGYDGGVYDGGGSYDDHDLVQHALCSQSLQASSKDQSAIDAVSELHMAISCGAPSEFVVRLIAADPAMARVPNQDGRLPIAVAIGMGAPSSVIEALRDAAPDVEDCTESRENCHMFAQELARGVWADPIAIQAFLEKMPSLARSILVPHGFTGVTCVSHTSALGDSDPLFKGRVVMTTLERIIRARSLPPEIAIMLLECDHRAAEQVCHAPLAESEISLTTHALHVVTKDENFSRPAGPFMHTVLPFPRRSSQAEARGTVPSEHQVEPQASGVNEHSARTRVHPPYSACFIQPEQQHVFPVHVALWGLRAATEVLRMIVSKAPTTAEKPIGSLDVVNHAHRAPTSPPCADTLSAYAQLLPLGYLLLHASNAAGELGRGLFSPGNVETPPPTLSEVSDAIEIVIEAAPGSAKYPLSVSRVDPDFAKRVASWSAKIPGNLDGPNDNKEIMLLPWMWAVLQTELSLTIVEALASAADFVYAIELANAFGLSFSDGPSAVRGIWETTTATRALHAEIRRGSRARLPVCAALLHSNPRAVHCLVTSKQTPLTAMEAQLDPSPGGRCLTGTALVHSFGYGTPASIVSALIGVHEEIGLGSCEESVSPLHQAIWCAAPVDIISRILKLDPTSARTGLHVHRSKLEPPPAPIGLVPAAPFSIEVTILSMTHFCHIDCDV
jgi:hypothetical protein